MTTRGRHRSRSARPVAATGPIGRHASVAAEPPTDHGCGGSIASETRRDIRDDLRFLGTTRRHLEAGERLAEPALPGERAREAPEVTDRCDGPRRGVAERAFEMAEQTRERSHVLVVVPRRRRRGSRPVLLEGNRNIAPGSRHRRRRHAGADRAAPLQRSAAARSASGGGRCAARSAGDRGGRRAAGAARPARRYRATSSGQSNPRPLYVTSQASAGIAAARADKSARSSACSGSSSWTCRKRSCSHHPRPMRNATVPAAVASPVVSVSRQTSGTSAGGWPGSAASRTRSTGTALDWRLGSDDDALGRPHDLGVDRFGEAHGELDGARVRPRGRRDETPSGRRPIAREPPVERRGRESHADQTAAAGTGTAGVSSRRRRSASARPSTSGSRRGPVHDGQPASQPHDGDEVGRGGHQLVVALPETFRQPDPTGNRLVQVDRRLLCMGRADLGDETKVAGVHHQQDRSDGLDGTADTQQCDIELVASPPAPRALDGEPVGRRLKLELRAGRSAPIRRSHR